VPANGDCNATGGHIDPYNRGEEPPCDPSDPATCQIGDLSGKHGSVTGTGFFAEYTDLYLSTDPSSNAFLGDKSIVIHAASGVRLNCGNFQLVSAAQANVARLNTSTRVQSSSAWRSSSHISARVSSTRPATSRTTLTRSVPSRTTSTTRTSARTTTSRH
jgi:hypothetical protein